MNNKYLHIIRLFRPAQWLKNGFVLLPLFFGGKVLDWECWRSAIPAFFAFCLMASAVYCLNDVRDVEADRIHPQKCRRPVASDAVSVATATGVMILLIAVSLAIALLLCGDAGIKVALVIAGYFVLNVAYCLKLKYYAIVDVFVVAFGFVLRLLCGGVAADIPLSPWIVLMTFLLALFLAFARQHPQLQYAVYESDARNHRSHHYNVLYPVYAFAGSDGTSAYTVSLSYLCIRDCCYLALSSGHYSKGEQRQPHTDSDSGPLHPGVCGRLDNLLCYNSLFLNGLWRGMLILISTAR